MVRPGQSINPVSFHEYYLKCWKEISFRWVFSYRKNLPTQGVNDTQAAESSFRALKYYIKVEFGSHIPSLSELCIALPKILDKRTYERENRTTLRRLIIHHPDEQDKRSRKVAHKRDNSVKM